MKKRKIYQAIMFERQVTLMFNQIAKKSGKTKSEFLMELLEVWRKCK